MRLPSALIAPTGRRTRPYTEAGVLRMACWRCGRRAAFQWSHRSCAQALTGEFTVLHFRPLCVPCDIECNRNVLAFYAERDLDEIIAAYSTEAWSIVHDDTGGAYCAEFPGQCPMCAPAKEPDDA